MSNASTDWPFWLAAALLGSLSLFILYRALFRDRSRGRRRCPKCWYDMSGASGLVCPECGRDAKREKRLYRTRRRMRWVVVGVFLVLTSIGLWKTPVVRRDGWPRLVPTWALVVLFPYCVEEMKETPSGSVLAEFELRGLQERAVHARPRSTPKFPMSAPDQLVLETVHRLASGEMARRQSAALVGWALSEQPAVGPIRRSTWILQAIAMHGILRELAPPEEVARVLDAELRRSVSVPPQSREGVPIDWWKRVSPLLRAHQGKTRLVVIDRCGRDDIAWSHEWPRLADLTPHNTPTGQLCPGEAGERVVVGVELWCTETNAPADEDYRKVYSTVIELPIEIVPAES